MKNDDTIKSTEEGKLYREPIDFWNSKEVLEIIEKSKTIKF